MVRVNGLNPKMKVVGKIRLGEKKISQGGKEYPTTVEHFVLHDKDGCAPIRKVYGDEPDSLDIVFLSDEERHIAPTSYVVFGSGKRGANGEVTPGRIRCRGNWPYPDGRPGEAMHFDKQDPLTGVVPVRPCLGPSCPDFADQQGRQQCKLRMSLYCILPRVSWDNLYQIDTGSFNSINEILGFLDHQRVMYKSVVARPYKLVREERIFKKSTQYIMTLRPNPEFLETHGKDVIQLLDNCKKNTFLSWAGWIQDEDDPQSLIGGADVPAIEDVHTQKVATAEEVVRDPEVKAAFDAYEKILGKTFTEKQRLIAVRKKEGTEDLKSAVLQTIAESIAFVKHEAMEKLKAPSIADVSTATEPLPATADVGTCSTPTDGIM